MRLVLVAVLLLFPLFMPDSILAQGNAEAGKTLWENVATTRCSFCHGMKGEGGFGPDLAGRGLSLEQFKLAVRKPWGIMPAYVESQNSDQDLANFHAYLTSLPKVAQPAPWRTPLPPNAPHGQMLIIATGCGQCHGALMLNPRTDAGAIGADFEWFKKMVYEHTSGMPDLWKMLGDPVGPIRMGNYSRTRLPESMLEEIWRYMRDDLKLRPLITSSLTRGTAPGTFNLTVANEGLTGKGLSAEDLSVVLVLNPGSKVANTTGNGYQGIRNDAQAKGEVAVWQLPRLGPKEHQTYSITVAGGGGIASGQVRWNKAGQSAGSPDQVAVTMPPNR